MLQFAIYVVARDDNTQCDKKAPIVMSKYDILTSVAEKVQALGNDVKLKILALLIEEGSKSITDISKELNINFSTAHKYLEQLEAAGLVSSKQISENRMKRIFTIRDFDLALSPAGISEMINGKEKIHDKIKPSGILDARSKLTEFGRKEFTERFVSVGIPLNIINEGINYVESKLYDGISLLELENIFVEYLQERRKKMDDAIGICESGGFFSKNTFAGVLKQQSDAELLHKIINGDLHVESLGETKLMNFSHDLHVLGILGIASPPKTISELFDQVLETVKDCNDLVFGKHALDSFNYFIAPFTTELKNDELSRVLENFFKKLAEMKLKIYLGMEVGTPRFFSYVRGVSPKLAPDMREKLDMFHPPGLVAETILYSDFCNEACRIFKAAANVLKRNKFENIFLVAKFWPDWAKFGIGDENLDAGYFIVNMIPLWQDANAVYVNSARMDSKWKYWYRCVRVGEVQNVVINLPRIALKSHDEVQFMQALQERLQDANRILLFSAEALIGELNRTSLPITHKKPKRGQYVHLDDCMFSISVCGLDEAVQILSKSRLSENIKLGEKILGACHSFAKEKSAVLLRTGIKQNFNETIAKRFHYLDSREFKIPFKSYSTGITQQDSEKTLSLQEKLNGGHCASLPKSKIKLKTLLKDNWGMVRVT